MAASFFSSSAFIFIMACFLAGLCAYIAFMYRSQNDKIAEQDRKLAGMVNVSTALTHEVFALKHKLGLLNADSDVEAVDVEEKQIHLDLISVSDTSNQEEEEIDDNDNDNDDDEDDDDDDDDELDLDQEDIVMDDELDENDSAMDDELEYDIDEGEMDFNFEPVEELVPEPEQHESEVEVEVEVEQPELVKTIHLNIDMEPSLDQEQEQEQEQEFGDVALSADIDATTSTTTAAAACYEIGEVKIGEKSDAKKMSLNKLRETVVAKGLAVDASRLKKQELLKLLGEEQN